MSPAPTSLAKTDQCGRPIGPQRDRVLLPAGPDTGVTGLDGLFDGVGMGLIVVANDRVVHANAEAARLFGYARSEQLLALGSAAELIEADERESVDGIAAELGAGRTAHRFFEATGLKADGSRIPLEVRPAPVLWKGRDAICAVVTAVPERRSLEALAMTRLSELAHHDRICTLGQMSATIMHEIAQPLTALSMSAGAVQRLLSVPVPNIEGARKTAALIVTQARRMRETTERIRCFAGGNARAREKREVIDIADAVEEAAVLTAPAFRKAGVVCRVLPFDEVRLTVHADPVQISQVLVNLLTNAVDAISAAGDDGDGKVTIRVGLAGPQVVIDVIDNGPGIPADVFERIFEPFFSTKELGMGVGLTVCRSIAESCGGSLTALSPPAGGAVFRLRLPRHGGRHG